MLGKYGTYRLEVLQINVSESTTLLILLPQGSISSEKFSMKTTKC
jgi:hypothetical protein